MDVLKINSVILSVLLGIGHVFSYEMVLSVSHNGPVVLGANITFTAELSDSLNQPPTGQFSYEWEDNASPHHAKHTIRTTNTTVYWNISYPSSLYPAGEYEVTVKAYVKKIIYVPAAHETVKFNVTDLLNGKMIVEQENRTDTSIFVSNTHPVKHTITLSQADHDFISNNATSVLTFWFVDCVYYGFSTDYTFSFNYTEEKIYNIEALVVASFDEPTTTTTSTTTSTTTTSFTTSTTTTTTTPTPIITTSSTSPKPNTAPPTSRIFTPSTTTVSPKTTLSPTSMNGSSNTSTAFASKIQVPHSTSSSSVANESDVVTEEISMVKTGEKPTAQDVLHSVLRNVANGGTVFLQKRLVTRSISSVLNTTKDIPFLPNISSYACLNSTFIPPDPNKTYGYFQSQISAKAPITKVVIKGNNWLQFGDVLNLNISCNGSGKFQHCTKIKIGAHNVTGNENCSSTLEGEACDFSLTHYFREANTYTYVIIIMNDVSKVVTPAVINMYKVTVQPQLSVIVVPVSCSLLAVIIIVFGVAYYVQSQNRYTVEVADFDFGQGNDVEYKSFYERLREDISNMFSRSGDFLDQAGVMPQRSKYDNMVES